MLTSLLVALTSALLWAYRTKKLSEEHINKMMQDMESLAKAEQALQEMQSRVDTGEQVREQKEEQRETEEVAILKEEVEILREELQRAEVESLVPEEMFSSLFPMASPAYTYPHFLQAV